MTVSKGKVFVGTAGFSYPDWKGIVYPPDLKKRKMHELQYLAQFYDCCEINNSFYRPLNPDYAKQWCDYVSPVNADFQFSLKLLQDFTHAPNAKETSTSVETLKPYTDSDVVEAKRAFDVFAEQGRLFAVLMQFPASFKFRDKDGKELVGNWDYLIDLIHVFREYPLTVEFREQSWNDDWVLRGLREERVAFCNIDQTRLGNVLEGTEYVTAPFAYLRLHGRSPKWFTAKNRDERYDYLYKPESIKKVADKAERIREQAERTMLITNNHYKGKAAVNASELKSLLSGTKVQAPKPLVEHYPELAEYTD